MTALAAALATMAARFADGGRPDDVVRAQAWQSAAAGLAQEDLAGYAAYVEARRSGVDISAALDEAVRIPLELAALAAEVAGLAAELVRDGNPRLRGDAATACFVAAAAVRSAAALVGENLAAAPDDPRVARAATYVSAAVQAEQAVLTHYPALTDPA